MVDDRLRMVFTRCASFELGLSAVREVVARERPGGLSRRAWSIGSVRTRLGEG